MFGTLSQHNKVFFMLLKTFCRRFVDVLLKSFVNLRTKSVLKCVYFCVRAFAVYAFDHLKNNVNFMIFRAVQVY